MTQSYFLLTSSIVSFLISPLISFFFPASLAALLSFLTFLAFLAFSDVSLFLLIFSVIVAFLLPS